MKKLLLSLCFLFILGIPLTAQSTLDTLLKEGRKSDSEYIYKFPNKLTITSYFALNSFRLRISDPTGFGNNVIYKPNTPIRMGFIATYKGFRMGISFPLPSVYPKRGSTKNFGFFFNVQTNIFSWGLDFYFLKSTGYYLANPKLNIPGWDDSMAVPFRKDITTINAGIATHMVFSRKFSLKAALDQTEKQLKSAGGIAADLAIKFTSLSNDSTIIPYSQQQFYEELTNFKKGGFLTLSIAPGYAHTFVIKKDFYSTSLAYMGMGLQIQNYTLEKKRNWALKIQPKLKFMQIIGYNAGKYFASIVFIYENNVVSISDSRFNPTYISINIGGGMRFK